jgi:hypothetical protein
LVHVLHWPKLRTTQFCGHAWPLQARVSAVCGQAAPPSLGCTLVRERDCTPAPHDLVHVVQALKLPLTQSTEHACALHARVSALCGQAVPPFNGSLMTRLRR